ncbi:hypothetical protein BD779DRAFT_1469204 [Infundibulicybe gibba]|nr:hypothetical protein BD779DRAFT_1469204 [Infundibulicybe gibba]
MCYYMVNATNRGGRLEPDGSVNSNTNRVWYSWAYLGSIISKKFVLGSDERRHQGPSTHAQAPWLRPVQLRVTQLEPLFHSGGSEYQRLESTVDAINQQAGGILPCRMHDDSYLNQRSQQHERLRQAGGIKLAPCVGFKDRVNWRRLSGVLGIRTRLCEVQVRANFVVGQDMLIGLHDENSVPAGASCPTHSIKSHSPMIIMRITPGTQVALAPNCEQLVWEMDYTFNLQKLTIILLYIYHYCTLVYPKPSGHQTRKQDLKV